MDKQQVWPRGLRLVLPKYQIQVSFFCYELTSAYYCKLCSMLMLGCLTDLLPIDTVIPAAAASKATSLWPVRRRTRGSGLLKLNRFQKEAIQLACNSNNKFVMIQGPPGKWQVNTTHRLDCRG